jgi:hypothetical protein
MPKRSKSRGQTKCRPWSSRLGVQHGDYDLTTEKFTVTKLPRRLRPTQGCSGSKEKKKNNNSNNPFYVMHSFFAK